MKLVQLLPALTAALSAGLLATAASAERVDLATTSASVDADIRFEVAGTISSRCTVTQDRSEASFGDVLDQNAGGNIAATLDLSFSFACNSPFRVAMTSMNGGLSTQSPGGAPFRNRMSYTAALAFGGREQAQACVSTDMMPGAPAGDRCVYRVRTEGGAAGPATVKLSMAADSTPVLAGRYSDRLVVRITPLLGGDTN